MNYITHDTPLFHTKIIVGEKKNVEVNGGNRIIAVRLLSYCLLDTRRRRKYNSKIAIKIQLATSKLIQSIWFYLLLQINS